MVPSCGLMLLFLVVDAVWEDGLTTDLPEWWTYLAVFATLPTTVPVRLGGGRFLWKSSIMRSTDVFLASPSVSSEVALLRLLWLLLLDWRRLKIINGCYVGPFDSIQQGNYVL